MQSTAIWDSWFQMAGAGIMGTQAQHENEIEPMLKEQFDTAVEATQIRNPRLIEACRAVLVDGRVATDVVATYGLQSPNVYRAIATIKEKWDQICAKEGWDYCPVALPRNYMKLILELQR